MAKSTLVRPLLCALFVLSLGLAQVALASTAERDVAGEFVIAANKGDYRTVCRLYSASYLKVSQASCRRLYRWGARLYGRYDYRIVGRYALENGRWRIDLIRWQHPSFIELARERTGWRIVAGGW